uniref:DNA-3-methyladenine glycosylase I n=2 Tax=Kalanchoe fedtschenkoi TaxID=63787 RepID=A0A7N0TGU7_KALFE
MSGAPKVRSMNVAESEKGPGLGQNGNKPARLIVSGKQKAKPARKVDKPPEEEKKASLASATKVSSPISNQERLLRLNYSMNASCSSDASSDSFHSRASTGRMTRSSSSGGIRSRQFNLKSRSFSGSANVAVSSADDVSPTIKRCAWVTPTTDPAYAAFHDEEWGVPEHSDRKLFEFLVLCGALAELTWPAILSKRHVFRGVFLDFDPVAVSKLNEKKLVAPGSAASSLLSELKLRSIIQNAAQITKVMEEFGSFEKYIWSFVNNKPIVNSFRYPRQVPVKTPKADLISKDLVRRGFRSVGPTVIYSFMQVAGITNDHLISCHRFHDCMAAAESKEEKTKTIKGELKPEPDISKAIDEFSLASE